MQTITTSIADPSSDSSPDPQMLLSFAPGSVLTLWFSVMLHCSAWRALRASASLALPLPPEHFPSCWTFSESTHLYSRGTPPSSMSFAFLLQTLCVWGSFLIYFSPSLLFPVWFVWLVQAPTFYYTTWQHVKENRKKKKINSNNNNTAF